jgi:hypothetical protein
MTMGYKQQVLQAMPGQGDPFGIGAAATGQPMPQAPDPNAPLPDQVIPPDATLVAVTKDNPTGAPSAVLPMGPPPPPPGPPIQGQPADNKPEAPQGPSAPSSYGTPTVATVGHNARIPAHDVATKSEATQGKYELANVAQLAAGDETTSRNETQALNQAIAARIQEDDARGRLAQVEADSAKHQQRLADLATDYDDSIADLAKLAPQPGKFWANKSTGTKVGLIFADAIAAFGSGFQGKDHKSIIQREIDRDMKAQEAMYSYGLDKVKGTQTAYGLAMQKFGDKQMAGNAARIASLDAIDAQAAQLQATAKGADAQNAMASLRASIQQQRATLYDGAHKYVQASQAKTERITLPDGRVLPGLYTPKEANEVLLKYGLEFQQKNMQETAKGVLDIQRERAKAGAEKETKREARTVTLPSGRVYEAPTEKEAADARDRIAATQEVLDLTKRVRDQAGALGYGDKAGAKIGIRSDKVKGIETNMGSLIGALNRMQKFGALDKGAQELLGKLTGDPTSVLGNSAQLDEIERNANEARRRDELSATGSKPPTAPAGSKKAAW